MLTPPPHSAPPRKRASRSRKTPATDPLHPHDIDCGGLHEPCPALCNPHIGVDEAGRGCLAGPVVAAAVLFPAGFDAAELFPGLNDSKKLSEAQRDRLAGLIVSHVSAYGIGLAWQDEIDRVNIRNATFRAMSRAVLALVATAREARAKNRASNDCPELAEHGAIRLPRLIIDGNAVIPKSQWIASVEDTEAIPAAWSVFLPSSARQRPSLITELPEQAAVVEGDSLIPAISAASILAKTARDSLMTRLGEFFLGYSFSRHKGYGTKEHLAALESRGPCALHRKTFRRVRPEQKQASLF